MLPNLIVYPGASLMDPLRQVITLSAMTKASGPLTLITEIAPVPGTVAGAHIAKVLPTSIASFVVFFIVGVWHGASWKYVGFGVWNGGIIMISVLMKPVFEWCHKKLHINPKSAPYTVFQILRTFRFYKRKIRCFYNKLLLHFRCACGAIL